MRFGGQARRCVVDVACYLSLFAGAFPFIHPVNIIFLNLSEFNFDFCIGNSEENGRSSIGISVFSRFIFPSRSLGIRNLKWILSILDSIQNSKMFISSGQMERQIVLLL